MSAQQLNLWRVRKRKAAKERKRKLSPAEIFAKLYPHTAEFWEEAK